MITRKKRLCSVFSMLSLDSIMTPAQTIYVHVEQEGIPLEQLGTAEFDASIDSQPCVEFVDGKAVMTIDGTTYNVSGVLCVATADRTKRVFFPAAGNVQNIQRSSKSKLCTYWSSSLYPKTKQHAYCQYVNNTKVLTQYSGLNRAYGLVVRPVSN